MNSSFLLCRAVKYSVLDRARNFSLHCPPRLAGGCLAAHSRGRFEASPRCSPNPIPPNQWSCFHHGKEMWNARCFSLSCPPRPPVGGCSCPSGPGRGSIEQPPKCSPGPIPPNPCCPVFPHGKDTWKKYRLVFILALPLIVAQMIHAFSQPHHGKTECRDYEYMRIRSKRFPWGGSTGDGKESLFHNPHTNFLPGECELPPLEDCD